MSKCPLAEGLSGLSDAAGEVINLSELQVRANRACTVSSPQSSCSLLSNQIAFQIDASAEGNEKEEEEEEDEEDAEEKQL